MSRTKIVSVIVVGLSIIGGALPAGAVTTLQPTGKDLQRWSASWMAPKKSYTQSEAVAAAQAFDLVVAQLGALAPYASAMRSANPKLKILGYVNGMWAPDLADGSLAYPLDWYAKDANGNRILWTPFHTYLMFPTASWAQDRAGKCTDQTTLYGYDGCLLDNLGTSPIVAASDKTGVPIDPSTGQVYTASAWLSATSSLARTVKSANTNRIVTGNGLRNAVAYFDKTAPSSVLADALDAAMDEGFVRAATASPTAYKSETAWKKDVDMLVDAGTHGRKILTMTKMWTTATDAERDSWHKFSLGTFLLGTNGTSYFQWLNDKLAGASTVDHPWDRDQLGRATESYAKVGGVYRRHFESGLVLVNPTSSSVNVALDGSYVDIAGGGYSGNIVMAPESALILKTNSCLGDTTPPSGSYSLARAGSDAGYTSNRVVQIASALSDQCGPIQISFSNDGTNFSSPLTYNTAQPSIDWTLSAGDGTKQVWARIQDGAGNASVGDPHSIILDTTAPTAPAGVGQVVSCSGATRTVTISWGASTEAHLSGYLVYRSTNGTSFPLLASTTSTSSTDQHSKTMNSVTYRVSAKDHAGNETAAPNLPTLSKNQCS